MSMEILKYPCSHGLRYVGVSVCLSVCMCVVECVDVISYMCGLCVCMSVRVFCLSLRVIFSISVCLMVCVWMCRCVYTK